jgi:hypothetical protein
MCAASFNTDKTRKREAHIGERGDVQVHACVFVALWRDAGFLPPKICSPERVMTAFFPHVQTLRSGPASFYTIGIFSVY